MWTSLEGYTVIKCTDDAVLIQNDTTRIWVPRSLLIDGDIVAEDDCDLTVRTWFAEKNGLESTR